ncbi:MAG TPA: hypothetical protein VGK73_29480, partial [Polyangiaceae bacterium]
MTGGAPSRRRRVELTVESSDVRRLRGVGLAALAGALVLVAALAAIDGPKQVLAPGPLARPHRAIACASCHSGTEPLAACSNCHGDRRSRRSGHQALAASGALDCGTCHGIHGSEQGIAFESGGRALHYGPGFEVELDG